MKRTLNTPLGIAVYTTLTILSALLTGAGVDPLALTTLSMVLTSAVLPLALVPFLVIMNDRRYLGQQCNGWVGNTAAIAIPVLAAGLAVISLPLAIARG